MCGITGIFHYADLGRPVDRDRLTRMTRAIAHRGPDGEGFFYDAGIGLGHRRLAIVDLSPTGAQPMALDGGAYWLAYNGELYNHGRFRAELAAQGRTFRGSSDTETLLTLLADRGPDALTDAAGIFALALWERDARRLTLARDPMGVKQLYYHDDGRRIVFASEIKALLECDDIPRRLDPEALNQYVHFHTPLFERTFLRDVKQLRAGEFLRITAEGRSFRRYWQVDDFTPRGGSAASNVEALQRSLSEVVREQLMSDVPVGAFFSGGIDSTAVAAYAQRNGLRPQCFGVHFSGGGVIDERPYQESAARALGLDLDLITVSGDRFGEDLTRQLYFQDQPVIGHAMMPMDAVAALAARKVKVCVGGQAADEIFGGYARYALTHPLSVASQVLSPRRLLARKTPSPAGVSRAPAVGGNVWKQLAERRTLHRIGHNLRHGLSGLGDWRDRYFENFGKVPEGVWHALLGDRSVVSRASARRVFRETVDRSPAVDPADKAMHWDMQTYLTGLFQQDDRMSMAHSLESRVPLADPRLVRFAFQSGFGLKFRDGASKWILRQAVADVLPPEVLNRRKVGFDTPAEQWLKGPQRGFLLDLLTSTSARQRGLWNTSSIERFVANDDHPLWFDVVWKLVCVETWARLTLDGEFRGFSSAASAAPTVTVAASEALQG